MFSSATFTKFFKVAIVDPSLYQWLITRRSIQVLESVFFSAVGCVHPATVLKQAVADPPTNG